MQLHVILRSFIKKFITGSATFYSEFSIHAVHQTQLEDL